MFRRREVERAMRAGIRAITNVRKVHTCPGNWDYNSYMHGMANGLILTESFFSGCGSPEFLDAPEVWGEDYRACAELTVCGDEKE